MPAQEGQNIVFGVDDCTQHPIVLLKTDKALKLVHFPVQALLHLVERSHLRVAPPLDGAWPQRKGQMQKSDEPQLLILPAREKIPGDKGFRLFAQLGAEAGKDPPGLCVVGGDLLHRVEGSRLPLRGPDREG